LFEQGDTGIGLELLKGGDVNKVDRIRLLDGCQVYTVCRRQIVRLKALGPIVVDGTMTINKMTFVT